jgi:hypothetical protein
MESCRTGSAEALDSVDDSKTRRTELKKSLKQSHGMKRTALSSVQVAIVISISLALAIWTLLGVYYPGQIGFGSGGLFSARILAALAGGAFVVSMAVWSRLRRKKDEDL